MAIPSMGFEGFQIIAQWGMYFVYFVIALILGGGLAFLLAWMFAKTKEKTIYEIDLATKKIKKYSARVKTDPSGRRRLWVKSHNCFLPLQQTKHMFSMKRKDIIFLLKDYNNLLYTLGVPEYPDLRDWINNKYNINIDKEANMVHQSLQKENVANEVVDFNKSFVDKLKEKFVSKPQIHEHLDLLTSIFFLPNPAEDLNYLASEVTEAKKTFAAHWYDNPTLLMVAYFGMMFVCTIIWIFMGSKFIS